MNVITLTTDFGLGDWFVGSMKGVILGINPQARIVDITHNVPAGDIRAGAFALLAAYRCFPRNTVHLAVVDPGVGSERAPIAARTDDYFFVGPDNGVLSFALAREHIQEVRRLQNEILFRTPVSNTFHGRDIFAPVAARLSNGMIVDAMGELMDEYVALDWPAPQRFDAGVRGEILCIDHFGNAITNIEADTVAGLPNPTPKVFLRGKETCGVGKYYQEVPVGQPLALIGSTGFLEIAVNAGHAARSLGLKIGDGVEVR